MCATPTMAQPRIDLRKLARTFLVVLVLPSVLAMTADATLGTAPILTIAAVVICIPAATYFVGRIALQEMDRVIQLVAPPDPDEEDDEDAAWGRKPE